MDSMSNKALSVGSRGTIQHSASPRAVWGLLTPPSVLYYSYSTLLAHRLYTSCAPVYGHLPPCRASFPMPMVPLHIISKRMSESEIWYEKHENECDERLILSLALESNRLESAGKITVSLRVFSCALLLYTFV